MIDFWLFGTWYLMQTDQSREPNLEELKKSRVGDQSEIQKDWDVTVTFVSVVDVPGAGVPGTVPGTGTVLQE
jgi:hypothetical protein